MLTLYCQLWTALHLGRQKQSLNLQCFRVQYCDSLYCTWYLHTHLECKICMPPQLSSRVIYQFFIRIVFNFASLSTLLKQILGVLLFDVPIWVLLNFILCGLSSYGNFRFPFFLGRVFASAWIQQCTRKNIKGTQLIGLPQPSSLVCPVTALSATEGCLGEWQVWWPPVLGSHLAHRCFHQLATFVA